MRVGVEEPCQQSTSPPRISEKSVLLSSGSDDMFPGARGKLQSALYARTGVLETTRTQQRSAGYVLLSLPHGLRFRVKGYLDVCASCRYWHLMST